MKLTKSLLRTAQWAVIQSGYALFGYGRTELEALTHAIRWMDHFEDEDGAPIKPTVAALRARLVPEHDVVDGDLFVTNDAETIRDYLKNQ